MTYTYNKKEYVLLVPLKLVSEEEAEYIKDILKGNNIPELYVEFENKTEVKVLK